MQDKKRLIGVDFLKEKIKNVSHKAGVYRMLDEKGVVLYVGKAKNLKNRLLNYTRLEQLSYRIRQMVSETRDLIVIETAGETEAFLLENDLIKQFHPHYNILLKDDKSYPYIVITQEEMPRLLKYRGTRRLKGSYFGPFPSGLAVKQTMTELQKIFGLRTCTNSYFQNRTRPCLLHQIKRCGAPCCNCISKEEYHEQVAQAIDFLKGDTSQVQEKLKGQMAHYASIQAYEQAGIIRDKIIALNHIQDTQSETPLSNTDIIALFSKNGETVVQIFFYRTGKAQGNMIAFLPDTDKDTLSETLSSYLMQFYDTIAPPRQIYLSIEPEENLADALSQRAGYMVHINPFPTRGSRKKLTDQALQNAEQALIRKQSESDIKDKTWQKLQDLLQISALEKVEIYDNSHIQGASAVGAMVCATKEGFQKDKYRRFNIDGTDAKTNDDFGMMREVMRRRLMRGLKDNDLPSAMLIDGGKGQLSSILEIMDELNVHSIALLAVAKGENRNAGEETLFLGTDPQTPIHLDLKSDLIHLIQRLRDEAHRFAIGSHRLRRAKNMFHETLLDIEGIGQKRKKELLAHFGSPKAIAGASLDQIMRVPGINEKIAKKIYTFYHD